MEYQPVAWNVFQKKKKKNLFSANTILNMRLNMIMPSLFEEGCQNSQKAINADSQGAEALNPFFSDIVFSRWIIMV